MNFFNKNIILNTFYILFTPSTPSNWSVVPTTVQEALDTLITTQGLNLDGGTPDSNYGGISNLDGGVV